MDRYAVVGNPVAHSLSPRIHAAFARATGEAVSYETLLAPLDDFAGTVTAFFTSGGAGLNVTVPFKEQAARWVTECDTAAALAGAVNTIVPTADGFRGCNTDGAGLIRDLLGNCGRSLGGQRVLLLGAGGAARGIVRPLLDEGPARLVIANRTSLRAVSLASTLRAEGAAGRDAEVDGTGFDTLHGGFDLVLNATSADLGDGAAEAFSALDPRVADGAFCYDLMYRAGATADTAFCRWARRHGAAGTVDGLGMLVEQAALAFELWRGIAPATAPVLELLRGGDV